MEAFRTQGFSGVAVLVVAAVVVGGGAVAWSVSNSGSGQTNSDTQANATATEATTESSASAAATTTFACNQDRSVRLSFNAGQDTELILPSGETVVVSRTQVDGETRFVNSQQSVELRNESDGAVIEENGEVIVDGCIQAGTRTQADDTVPTSSPTETQVEANTQADIEIDSETDTEARGSTEIDTTATASAETVVTSSEPTTPVGETEAQLDTEVQTQN